MIGLPGNGAAETILVAGAGQLGRKRTRQFPDQGKLQSVIAQFVAPAFG